MTGINQKTTLSGSKVKAAMRRQVIRLSTYSTIGSCIRTMLKYKADAVLICDQEGKSLGIVSKTDIMTAYYAELPLSTPIDAILVGPVLCCAEDDCLESSLDTMHQNAINRLYVLDAHNQEQIKGILAYPDIVGLLYRYCKNCVQNIFKRDDHLFGQSVQQHLLVNEVMGRCLRAHGFRESLMDVMETLAAYKFGAVLIKDEWGKPAGVLSKTDLMHAYYKNFPVQSASHKVMNSPVYSCAQEEHLASAIQKMIYSDVQRLFVYKADKENIVGVLSLSDAARARSGSCRACIASRITDHAEVLA